MGEVQSKDPKVENPCVFNGKLPPIKCPVRKEIKASLDIKKSLSKHILPLGDKEVMKIYAPLIDKLEQSFHSEFGLLHFYCAVCPLLRGKE